ncbi:MAG: hypothetical protein ABH815_05205 [Candidatus Omnitrophota bacterium]
MRIKLFLLASFMILSISVNGYANDFSHRVESEYFTVYYQDQVDPLGVAYKIKVDSYARLSGDRYKVTTDDNPNDVLSQNVDALFNEVSDILDMHIYSYHGIVKICRDSEALKKAYVGLFDRELKAESFYYHEENTIFVNAADLNPGILAHEISHALINHYFVVVPPVKVQEVLSGYVEYNIRKMVPRE